LIVFDKGAYLEHLLSFSFHSLPGPRQEALSALLDAIPEDTLAGDVRKINRWVEFLGIEGWFEWIDFERVPSGYEEAL
jgi:hypothetical protein